MNSSNYQKSTIVKTRNILRLTLLLLVALGFPMLTKATHIVGGEIGYRCLGNNQYEIILKVYRDCFNGREDFDDPAFIGIYDLAGNFVRRINVDFTGIRDTLNSAVVDPCLVTPGNVCVDTTTYKTVVTLNPNPVGGAYQITYVRCCRNKTINNIVAPDQTGAVYDIYLTKAAMERCNTSPVFNQLPPNFLCAQKPFIFDHSATDADGDSLYYRICTPLSGGSVSRPKPRPPVNPPPFDEVQWAPGYSLENLFGSGVPLEIDQVTGLLTATPELQGQFVVGICVEEYDRTTGELLSVTRRDFQYNVVPCGDVLSSFFSPNVSCDKTVTFENGSESADEFIWYFDWPNTNLISTQLSPTFTFPDTGTYTIALIAEPTSPCVDTFFRQIVIRDNTIDADFQVEVFDCDANAVLQLGDESQDPASSIIAWNWVVTYGDLVTLTSTERNPSFVVPLNIEGNISLTVTSANGCLKTIEKTFETVIDIPPGDLIPDTITVCAGALVALNPNTDPNTNFVFRWSPGANLSDSTAVNPTFIATQTSTFSVTITQPTPVCEIIRTVTVLVNQNPSLDLTADRTAICVGESATLTANVIGSTPPLGFVWNPTLSNSGTQLVSPLITTIYNLTVTDANGCSATDQLAITVSPAPSANISADRTTLCVGESATLTASATSGTGNFTFIWDNGLGSNPVQTVTPSQTTTYSVTVLDANGCQDVAQITITVNPLPELLVDTVACAPSLATYFVELMTNATDIASSEGTIVNNGNGSFSIIDVPANRDITITATFGSTGCQNLVNINAPSCECDSIPAPISGGNQSACEGQPLPILTVTVESGQTVDWYDAPTGGNLLLSGSNTFTPTQAGTYFAETREIASGCVSDMRTAVALTVNPNPLADAGGDQTACANDEVSLNANASGGAAPYTFVWNQGLGNGQTRTVRPAATTTYIVTVTDANGCTDTDEVTVTINPLPEQELVETECSADLTTYLIRIVTNADTMTASAGTVSRLSNDTFVVNGIPVGTNVTTIATIFATGCRSELAVNAPDCDCPDNIAAPTSNGDQSACEGQPFPALTVTVQAGQTVDWYDAALDGNLLLAGSTSFTPTQPGTYYAETRDLVNNCTSLTRTAVTLTVNPSPAATASASQTTICAGESTILTAGASGGTEPYSFNWDNGLGSGANQVVSPTQTTTYTVTVSDALGCTANAQVTITVNPRPTAQIDTDRSAICIGQSATLTATASGGLAPYTFQWDNGLGEGATKTVMPIFTTTYTVTITDANGCSNTAQITITVNPEVRVMATADQSTICVGDTATLTAMASGGLEPYTFQWDNGLGEGAVKAVSPAQTTTYTVTATDANGCSNTAQVTITLFPNITANIAADQNSICIGDTVTLNVNVDGGIQPFDFVWDNGLPAGQTQVISPTQTTTYNVTITDANGCSAKAQTTITVNAQPTVDASASDATICEGTSTTLTATGQGGTPPYTFSWDNNLGEGQNQTVSPTTTTLYSVTLTDVNGCTATDTISIIVNPTPEAAIDADRTTVCAGQSATLTATATGGTAPYTFNWDNGLGTNSIQIVTPAQTTTYTVTVTDANGCSDTAQITITVTPPPTVEITASNDTICLGQSTTLTANVTGGNAPYIFEWDNNLPNGQTQMVSPTQTTTYRVTVTAADGCGSATAQITIVVNPIPAVAASANDSTICAGDQVTLSAAGSGGTAPYTFSWSGELGNGQTRIAFPEDTTTFTVTITDANGCTNTDAVTINVNPTPEATIDADRTSVCRGQSATLTASAEGGATPYTFNWSNGLGTNPTQVVTPNQTTTYGVTITDANGCSGTDAITIVVTEPPVVQISADRTTICQGDSAILTATVTGGFPPYEFIWSDGITTGSTLVVGPTQTTNYMVTVTDAQGCSTATDDITITVNPRPTVEVLPSDTIICVGEGVEIIAAVSGGTAPYTFNWDKGFEGGIVFPTDTTVYSLTVTDANGCKATGAATVNTFPIVSAEITADPAGIPVCPGEVVFLNATALSGTGPFQFVWDNGLGEGANKQVTPAQTTTYTVTVTDGNGCTTTAQLTVEVTPVNATLPAETTLCEPTNSSSLTVTNLDPTQQLSYNWSPANAIVSGINEATAVVNPTVASVFTVEVENQYGCRDTLQASIIVINLRITAAVEPDTIFQGEQAQLNVVTDCQGCTYSWTPTGVLNDPNIQNPIATPTETTTFSVTVTLGQCTAEASVQLVVLQAICDPSHVFLPNAFSPNGDGNNDIFRLRSNFLDQLLEMELIVFNRWGQKMFETTNPLQGWDGKFNGEELPPDVYGYYLRVVCPNEEELIQKGNVTLLR